MTLSSTDLSARPLAGENEGAGEPAVSMRVLMVIAPAAGTTAVPVWVRRQIQSLVRLGLHIDTYLFENRRSLRGLLQGGAALREKARECRADLVHVHYGAAQALIAVLFASRPVIVSFCGSDLFGNYASSGRRTWSGRLSRLLSQTAAFGCRRSIAKSEELRRSLWTRAMKSKCEVIPNGVDLGLFHPIPQADARRALGWFHTDPVVVFMDRRGAWVKDPELAQAAYEEAKKEAPSLRLHVLEHERPERMGLFYNAADALLLTSRHEGSNNTVKEALACNLPVVATSCGDVRERVQGVHACHVCARDSRALGRRLAEVVTRRERSNGREHLHGLTLERVAASVLRCYERALGAQRTEGCASTHSETFVRSAVHPPFTGVQDRMNNGRSDAPGGCSLDRYAAHLARNGTRLVTGGSENFWVRYESVGMMRVPTFDLTPPDPAELSRVLRHGPAMVATHLLEPDTAHPANAWLYLCRDRSYDVSRLNAPGRRDARRAARMLRLAFIDWPTVLSEGARAFADTRRRVGLSDGTPDHFRKRITRFSSNPSHVAVGAWKDHALVAFMTLAVVEDWVEIEGSFSTDEHRGLCPNDGLANFVLRHFLVERGAATVSYGLSSIQDVEPGGGLHGYKTKVGFEAKPVHRAFVVHPLLKPLAHPARHAIKLLRGICPQNRMMKKAGGVLDILVSNGKLSAPLTEHPR